MLRSEGKPERVTCPKEAWERLRMCVRQKQRLGESNEEIRDYIQRWRKIIKDEFSEKTNQSEERG